MAEYVLMAKIIIGTVMCFVGAGLIFFLVSCVMERTVQEGYQIPGVGFVTKEQFEAAMKEVKDGQK